MKILLHIDESERWPMVVSNLKNMSKAKKSLRPDLEVEVVVTGEAIRDLINMGHDENIYQALKASDEVGFTVAGCHNSLSRYSIPKENIFSFVKVVPAGLIEVAEKESEGFAYVKP